MGAKSKIDWCDSTWNPVTGCLHGCEYCYARKIADRFAGFIPEENPNTWGFRRNGIVELDSMQARRQKNGKIVPAIYPFGFIPTFHRYKLYEPQKWKKGRNIFVCSMADLFGGWVPDEWIEEVFEACEKAPQHNYLFLTKNPGRYEFLHQKGILQKKGNMFYGYSYTKNRTDYWYDSQYNTFVSIEPILEPLEELPPAGWVIIGAETGNRKDKVAPKREWIENIMDECRKAEIPVFMKESLADIWGEPLIQEYPEKLREEA